MMLQNIQIIRDAASYGKIIDNIDDVQVNINRQLDEDYKFSLIESVEEFLAYFYGLSDLPDIVMSEKALTDSDQTLSLIADNMKIYNSARDIFIWDDQNLLLNVLRINTNPNTCNEKPIVLETFEYENIQYMRINSTNPIIDDILDRIII